MMNRIWKQRDDLVKENLRLQERIKLLDEYIHNLQKLGDSMALGRNPFIQNAWLEAKEANP
jgi:hypothetical protein